MSLLPFYTQTFVSLQGGYIGISATCLLKQDISCISNATLIILLYLATYAMAMKPSGVSLIFYCPPFLSNL